MRHPSIGVRAESGPDGQRGSDELIKKQQPQRRVVLRLSQPDIRAEVNPRRKKFNEDFSLGEGFFTDNQSSSFRCGFEDLCFKLDDINGTGLARKPATELNELKLVLRLEAIRVLYCLTKLLDRSTGRMGIDRNQVSHGDRLY
jgi:hypothetical protein